MSLLNDAYPRSRTPSPQPTRPHITSAITIPTSTGRASPALIHTHRNASLQNTPEGMIAMSTSLPAIPFYTLPESVLPPPTLSPPPTSNPFVMPDPLGKPPGLMRRVSRGAQGIPSRFRRNNSNRQRDKSQGPVIMRRRSDSRTAADADTGISDFDPCEEEESTDHPGDAPSTGLGISHLAPRSIPHPDVVAPIKNLRLEQGTVVRKITKKKKKDINLRLDFENARVYWDPSRPYKCFYIDDVREIRSGSEANHYREELGLPIDSTPYWITIVYIDTTRAKGRAKAMHLIAPDSIVFDMWTKSLELVSRRRIDIMSGLLTFSDKSARVVWHLAMQRRGEGQDSLDFPAVAELCRSLHINCTETTLRHHFQQVDTLDTRRLTQHQFLSFVRRLKERKDVKKIYNSLTCHIETDMDRDTFFSFLRREQQIDVDADVEHWTAVFERFARATKPKATTPSEQGQLALPLTMDGPAFQSYLVSKANSVFTPATCGHKLDRPLNEYFISSSHNTYLLGRQVAGESSTEAYIASLQKGCRCLEIDCWDGNDGIPVVMHGRTLTKSILFQDTIKVINKYAFTESQYPLILSLEVHCSPPQQVAMVNMMKAEFAAQLVLEPLNESGVLPSPEELRNRILIKVKSATGEGVDPKALIDGLSARRQRSSSSPWSRPVQLDNSLIPNSPLLSSPPSLSPSERTTFSWMSPRTSTTSTNNTLPTSSVVSSAEDSESPHITTAEPRDDRKKSKKAKTSKITRELGALGVYTKGVKFTDFFAAAASTYNHVFSINERAFERFIKPESREKHFLEDHNLRCLMRVYPHAFRINSSNFDPLMFWRRGVQMVALNWQTYDLGQQLNEAMFAGGDDRTGYVLKPSALRPESQTPGIGNPRAPKKEVKFSVQIISAQHLPRPRGLSPEANINPYVEFEMYCAEDVQANATGVGSKDANARNKGPLRRRTRIVEGNGYDPEFGNEIDLTVITRYPSLVFVRWTVWNSIDAVNTNHAPLATFTAKLSSIQQGFRHLPLFDVNGEQYLFSTLFCKFKKQEIVDAPDVAPLSHASLTSHLEPTSPIQDASNRPSRNFVKRLIHRTPSGRKKRHDYDSDLDFSRTSTMERV